MSSSQVHDATVVGAEEKSGVPPPAYTGPAPQTTAAAAATTSSTGDIAPAPVPQQQQPAPNQNLNYETYNEPAKLEQAHMQYAPQHDAAPSGPTRLVMPLANLQDRPVEVDCPYCRRVTMTRVEEHSSGMTILAGVLVGFFCICLACLPCIMHTCADVDHFCSNCNRQLTHRPYEGTTAVVAQGGLAEGPPPGAVPSKYTNASEPQK